jgi:hypothetical protein
LGPDDSLEAKKFSTEPYDAKLKQVAPHNESGEEEHKEKNPGLFLKTTKVSNADGGKTLEKSSSATLAKYKTT